MAVEVIESRAVGEDRVTFAGVEIFKASVVPPASLVICPSRFASFSSVFSASRASGVELMAMFLPLRRSEFHTEEPFLVAMTMSFSI